MRSVYRLAVHQRTAPDDAVHAPSLTFPNRFLGDAALAEGTVEPDARDATVGALPHDVQRDVGMRGYDNAIDGARDGAQVGEALDTLDLRNGGIDRQSLVTAIAELAEDGIGRLLAAAGDSGDGDALRAKEIGYGRWKSCHGLPA